MASSGKWAKAEREERTNSNDGDATSDGAIDGDESEAEAAVASGEEEIFDIDGEIGARR